MPKFVLIVVLGVCLVVSGCASTRYVSLDNPQSNEAPALQPGDTVRIKLKSGKALRLLVASADAETLTGHDLDAKDSTTSTQIALADVQKLEMLAARDISAGKTTALVVGIIVGVAAVLFGVFMIQCYSDGGQCSND